MRRDLQLCRNGTAACNARVRFRAAACFLLSVFAETRAGPDVKRRGFGGTIKDLQFSPDQLEMPA